MSKRARKPADRRRSRPDRRHADSLRV